MDKITLKNGKTVLASEPYRPREATLSTFVGRLRELKMVTAAWIGSSSVPPLCPLLLGEPGVGKNRLVYELARRTGLDLYIFQGHEDVTAEDLACTVRFSDEPGRTMDYVVSPLVTAMHRGGICFIDEIGKIRPRALALLVSVLDERRYIDSTLLGERVQAHPRFRFIAATNIEEMGVLPEFIRSRMRPVIEVGYPPKEEIDQIISRQTSSEPEIKKLLQTFWDLFTGIKHPPSPRDAIHLFALAASLRDFDASGAEKKLNGAEPESRLALEQSMAGIAITPEHLNEAFQQLFKQGSS
jgi:MoxR-like ATPase